MRPTSYHSYDIDPYFERPAPSTHVTYILALHDRGPVTFPCFSPLPFRVII